MCGRSVLYALREDIIQRINVDRWIDKDRYRPSYNVTPQRFQPIIYQSNPNERVIRSMQWGFVPYWSNTGKAITINTRDDSVEYKPLYRSCRDKNRCLIITQGYYEWETVEKKKLPFYYHRDGDFILVCGFYSIRNDEYTYTLITMDTTKLDNLSIFAKVHDRMPAMIWEKDDIDKWLDPSLPWDKVSHLITTNAEKIVGIAEKGKRENLKKDKFREILIRPVSQLVSSIKNDSAECIAFEKHEHKHNQKITSFFKRKDLDDSEDKRKKRKVE